MAVVAQSVQVARMVARLPTPTPSSMGYFYSPTLARSDRAAARARALRSHLRALLVGGAVRRARRAASRRSSTSATWIRRNGSNTRATSRFRCRSATARRAASWQREERRLASRFDLCTATTRAEWETLEAIGTGVADRLVSERRGQRLFRAGRRSLRSRHDRFVGRMDYYPNQECMFDFCANDAAAAARAPARRQSC